MIYLSAVHTYAKSVCGLYAHATYTLVYTVAIKLLEQQIKVLERMLKKMIRCTLSIDDMQFRFIPGNGTIDAIFIMGKVHGSHPARKKMM